MIIKQILHCLISNNCLTRKLSYAGNSNKEIKTKTYVKLNSGWLKMLNLKKHNLLFIFFKATLCQYSAFILN